MIDPPRALLWFFVVIVDRCRRIIICVARSLKRVFFFDVLEMSCMSKSDE
jgi:hypothetical protein